MSVDWTTRPAVELLRNVVDHALRYRPVRFVLCAENHIFVRMAHGGTALDPALTWISTGPRHDVRSSLTYRGSLTLERRVSLLMGWEMDLTPILAGETLADPTPFQGLFWTRGNHAHCVLAHVFEREDRLTLDAVMAR